MRRWRHLFWDELTVSRQSRHYADTLPSHLLTARNPEEKRRLNAHRPRRPRSGRWPLRNPFRRS